MSTDKTTSKTEFTRRNALKLLGLGTAGVLAEDVLHGTEVASPSSPQATEVVVVGAGFSGLAAARNLVRQGRKVIVLEARDRVGGRVKPGKLAGHTIDLGGMWVGPSQTRLLELLQEYGVKTTPQFLAGKDIMEITGRRVTAEGEDFGFAPGDQPDYDRLLEKLNALVAVIPVEAPWTAANAEELDDMTVDEWLRANTQNKAVLSLMNMEIRATFTAETYQISLLYFLFYLRSGNNFDKIMSFKNGAQAFHVPGSMHQLAPKMAAELGKALVMQAPVHEISQDAKGVIVVSEKGTWHANRAIVAIPIPLAARIAYRPELPPERDILSEHMPMGSVIKYWVAYEKPFWRDRGMNGLVLSDEPPTSGFADCSPPEGKPGFLVGFFEASRAIRFTGRPMEERKKVIVQRVVDFFGPEAANPIDYIDCDWPSDPWSRGCYGPSMGPGVLTSLGKNLRTSFGRIHWAGTETSPVWTGYIEGAIRSGERAAAEVMDNLK
ncbi:MAG: flavin monoamine oxidase family protein [Acidobacteriia bacterium]|nr:flavin monoamine oxidase family protein [Terriglobia bacterium]